MKVKEFSWVGIATDDFERSMRFYRDLLGLDVWVEGERQAILKTESLTRAPVVAFEVDDLDAASEELLAAGIELIGEVGRWNGFAWQYFRSPDGHIFEIKSSPA